MAIAKQVKQGGSYFKGHSLSVAATPGDYTLVITNTAGAALNGISISPDAYGAGDTFKLQHMDDVSGTGKIISILAEGVHNAGANAAIAFDFPALQLINLNQSLKFVYTNTASKAMSVYLISEWVGITKTA